MNAGEVFWRVAQKISQYREKAAFAGKNRDVTSSLFYAETRGLAFDPDRVGVNFKNDTFHTRTDIYLPGGFDYAKFRLRWHAGFQTGNEWPKKFSYDPHYKQCDAVGDARTNWELNRHFQFALLAKNFYATGESAYRDELQTLFDDWRRENPFLTGISWTSVMEVAIRAINWIYALAFLSKCKDASEPLKAALSTGIRNMIGYVARHYSRFSSANNHLIVEAAAMSLAGLAFGYEKWTALGTGILTDELPRQNYSDGVNKELSLHYQLFVMEAYALTAHALRANGRTIPESWSLMLQKMSLYTGHASWRGKTAIEFGDDDEGKILDLRGGERNHTAYILQLCALVSGTPCRYAFDTPVDETLHWLFGREEIEKVMAATPIDTTGSRCFREGGNTFLRDNDDRVLIGIDHAALGFGSIAAHGHADALSFQLMVDGNLVFADPGTYIYHCDLASRNLLRSTAMHNTLCVENRNQSEMLGAFLWGKKAVCRLENYSETENLITLTASHDGYAPVCHRRTFVWEPAHLTLRIKDELNKAVPRCCTLLVAPACAITVQGNHLHIETNGCLCSATLSAAERIEVDEVDYSPRYGIMEKTKAIRIYGVSTEAETVLKLELSGNNN